MNSDPPGGGYDVILVDIRHDPRYVLEIIERCLPKLSPDGAVLIHHSNPPSAWHQRPVEEFRGGSEWTGQTWRTVVAFRSRHPGCQVFTVDTDLGCTVIRPSRRAHHRTVGTPVDDLDWPMLATRRTELLNIVDVAWFRRYLYADPYLAGSARPSSSSELVNVLISAGGLDSYLQIGAATAETFARIIAPVRHWAGVDADATFRLMAEDFAASDLGLERYDLILIDGPQPDEERYRRDVDSALTRLSDRGWIVALAPPPQRFLSEHPECDCRTYEFDRVYTLIRRRADPTWPLPAQINTLREVFCRDYAAEGTGPSADTAALATQQYAGNRSLLLAAIELDPDDIRSMLYLGDTHFDAGDFESARTRYAQAVELRDWWWHGLDDGMYVAMLRVAQSMAQLGERWPDVRDAYLQAWELRPERTAPLHAIAKHYRTEKRYRLGYLFAKPAAQIPCPPADGGRVRGEVHNWRTRDELALCASWIDKRDEAFALWQDLLSRPDLTNADRTRIALNRDVCVLKMLEAASSYPDAVVREMVAGSGDPGIAVSLIAGPIREMTEQTLNSFLNCCLDISRVRRFFVFDAGLSPEDRAILQQRYGFLEFVAPGLAGPALAGTRLWMHIGQGWRFFTPQNLLTRLESVLDAQPEVFQVGVNLDDAVQLTGASAAEDTVCRTPDAGRYMLRAASSTPMRGPAMFDTTRLRRASGVEGIAGTDAQPLAELGRRASAARLRTASLDDVGCISQTMITVIGRGNSGTRAMSRTLTRSGVFMGEPIKQDSADLIPAEDMYEACRIISRYIPWRGGLEWDFGPVQKMPIPAEFTQLIGSYLASVLTSPAPRVGWKLPETTLCYPWIRRLFPDIRYIFWVRNPRDCITRAHFTDDLRDFGIEYPQTADPYLRRAISWKYQDDLVAATPRPRHWIAVRLEDFIQNQERELTRLEEYLGLPLARIPVTSDPIDRHKRLPGMPFPEFLKPAMRNHQYDVSGTE